MTALCALPAARFRAVLPLLRRAFGRLTSNDRRALLEHLIALRGLADKKHEARALLRSTAASMTLANRSMHAPSLSLPRRRISSLDVGRGLRAGP